MLMIFISINNCTWQVSISFSCTFYIPINLHKCESVSTFLAMDGSYFNICNMILEVVKVVTKVSQVLTRQVHKV